ncbi:GNAT family N-acetyltransferase [Nakamurella deserti]|uniref:GNAT family N-acetyltransferase n=1 Tax=Nakamurella deserti TaxID=2164074 RepID=UPI000DBE8483|nr:GNAT family N-acetyltransferase [Nakamurella deserti]
MQIRSLGYRTDLALLRLGGSVVDDRGDHLVVRSLHNPHHFWGNFLLLDAVPAPTDVDRWVDRFAATFPGAGRLTLGFDGTDGTVADLAAFTARGCSAEAQAVLTATEVRPPGRRDPAAEFRPLRDDADWAQSVELRLRCNTDDPSYDRMFVTAHAATQRRLVTDGPGVWFGAFVDGHLVAQLGLVRTGAGLARYQSVETDPAFRRRGLATGLLHDAGRHGLERLGARTLVIVADSDDVAVHLYRAIGFRDAETQCQVEGPG